jgi:hypothetical protein
MFVYVHALCSGGVQSPAEGSHVATSPWSSYDDVKAAFDSIELNKTITEDLKTICFDPLTHPNIAIVSTLMLCSAFWLARQLKKKILTRGFRLVSKLKPRARLTMSTLTTQAKRDTGISLLICFLFQER